MESRSPRTEKPDDKRQLVFVSLFIALVIIGISGFLGAGYLVAGALVPLAIVGALALLAIGQLSTNQEGRFLVEDAREHGTVAPIEYWGKVAVVSGECPEGVTPREGDTFIVTETFGRVLLRGSAGPAAPVVRPVPPPAGQPGFPPPGWSVKHVLLNGKDITDVPTEFSAAHSGRVQVVFTSRAPSLEGTVLDESGQPARATVLVFSVDEEAWTANSSRIRSAAVIREDGKFMIRALRAGRYYVAALPSGPIGGASAPDREFLRALKASATEVTLNEADARTVDLRLVRVQ